MAINNAPTISVGGQGNLKVFAIDYDVCTIDSPGKLTVTFIDPNNNLPIPTLSAKTASQIKIGSLSFTGYPVEYKRTRSATGENLLVVSYYDGSFILDKYFVGLRSKHCNSTTSYNTLYEAITDSGITFKSLKTFHTNTAPINTSEIPDWLIVVGTYIDPCYEKMIEDDGVDLCDPCPQGANSQGNDSNSIDCNKLRSTELSKVDYSFSELITALSNKSIKVSINSTYNDTYRSSYAGSLRDVLQSWCSDFGFSFVYNNNQIYIYDLKSGFTINPALSDSQIINKTEEGTITHTKSTACMAYVGIKGEDREYNCSSEMGSRIVCRPLSLKDLGANGLKTEYGTSSDSNFYNLAEFLCMLSGYSPTLREMVTWFDVYGIRNAEIARSFITSRRNCSLENFSTFGGGYYSMDPDEDKNEESYSLPLLNMTIKKVIASSDLEFQDIMTSPNIDDNTKKLINESSAEPYFVVASRGEAGFANKLNWEGTIATDFLGKYFIRWYSAYSPENPNFDGCQGDSIQFYRQGTSSLNFSNLMPYFAVDTPELSTDRNKYIKPSNFNSLPIYNFNSNQGTVIDSFILVERKPVWLPAIGEGKEIKEILKRANKHGMINLGQVSSYGSFSNDHPDVKDKSGTFGDQDMLFLCFTMPSGFNISITSGVNHREEIKNKDLCNVYKSEFQTPISLGMRSFKTTKVNIGGIADFYFPPQSKVSDLESGRAGGYNVYTKYSQNVDYKMAVPKFEKVVTAFYSDDNVIRNDVNYKDSINLDNIDIVKIRNIKGAGVCVPNYDGITQRMNDYTNNMKSLTTGVSKKENYEIAGLPTKNYTPLDGLISFSVRVGSKGATTSLTFSDMKDRTIDKSETLKESEMFPKETLSNSTQTKKIKRNSLSRDITNNTWEL